MKGPRLWILSDLHLESVPHPQLFRPEPGEFDVMVVAGDVWQGGLSRGFEVLARLARGKPIVFVMGNHEYWNGVHGERLKEAKALARPNQITLLEGEAATIAGCHFIGTTLWSDYRLAGDVDPDEPTGERIVTGHSGRPHPITVGDAIDLHRWSRARLDVLLQTAGDAPLVVVTHHGPHPDCIPAAYRGTWSAGNCASDLSDRTDSGRAALWIHGHLHHSIDMTRPGGTRILCNPAGAHFANPTFDETLIVEVGT